VIAAAPTPTVDDYAPAVIAELKAELAAREADLDALVNTLNGAIAERNEAIEMLKSANLVIPVEMADNGGGEGK
jgi:hypothetical protein